MLTGLSPADYSESCGAFVYGNSINTEMNSVRRSMGVCPQHDVLFENLTVLEHILFFAQLKGASYAAALKEAQDLTKLFHLEKRTTHLGSELSGGQKRKLSVAIAVCGGSKFVVLDEPTAGMDPLARRELWDLLASLRIGRTMLLTTHYMDEADILGDRVAIMSLGTLECVGSPHFLKQRYGSGYKLIFNPIIKGNTEVFLSPEEVSNLTKFVVDGIPGATEAKKEANLDNQLIYILPFSMLKKFGDFFTKLEENMSTLKVSGFGISLPTLEDVFLQVGADESVRPRSSLVISGIGSERRHKTNFISQVIGLVWRKLTYAKNDFTTIPLLLLPSAAAIAGTIIYTMQLLTESDWLNDLLLSGIYVGAYLAIPGLIAEFVVRERENRLRNVLTISGCGIEAYWIGTFIADYIMMSIPAFVIFITCKLYKLKLKTPITSLLSH
jgi:ABC-type multidrug transport system ATPase subunit